MGKSIFFKNYMAAKAAHSEIKRNARQSSKSSNFDEDLRYISQIILSGSYVGQYQFRPTRRERLNRVKIRFDHDLLRYHCMSDKDNNRLSDNFMEALEMTWYAIKHNLLDERLLKHFADAKHFSVSYAETLYNEISERYSDPDFHVLSANEIYYGEGGAK